LIASIKPTKALQGAVRAPPSKARTHRALFAGLLSKGTTEIHNPLSCDDTYATANVVSSLGAKLDCGTERWSIRGVGKLSAPRGIIDCGESGVTLRFTVPISSLLDDDVRLRGREGLIRRPLRPLVDAMGQLGIRVDVDEFEVRVHAGPAKGGRVQIPGNVSSQFISGLLFAGPLMIEGLRIEVTSHLESRGYVSVTIEELKRHTIAVETNSDMSFFSISPHQIYRPAQHLIPGDYSSAAFLMAAAAVTRSRVIITGLPEQSEDPD